MIEVKSIPSTATAQLRQTVLRPHQQQKDLVYPNDMHDETVHFGAYVQGELVGVGSIYNESRDAQLGTVEWRIRGMAVNPDFRGKKIGEKVLLSCINHARTKGAKIIWCNARTTAVAFYEAYGFKRIGSEFDIQGIGPHFLMVYELNPI